MLFVVTSFCTSYCRFCIRKRNWHDSDAARSREDVDQALAYIRAHPEIRDVLISGGDPLTLPAKQLDYALSGLRAIPHVEIVRFGSREPVQLPMRITPELTSLLERHAPVWLNTHFNHPREITAEAALAVDRLLRAGIPVNNQSVLLRGVNDSLEVMRELVHGLLRIKVRPYYLYHCDDVVGAAHLRTSVRRGLEILEGLRGHTTGFAVPTFVVDAPGGGGKIPLMPNYLVSQGENSLVVRNFEGVLVRIDDGPAAAPEEAKAAARRRPPQRRAARAHRAASAERRRPAGRRRPAAGAAGNPALRAPARRRRRQARGSAARRQAGSLKAAVVYSRLPAGQLAPDDDRFEEFDAPDVPAAVAAALARLGHAARAIEDDARLVGRLRRERPDFVVNLAEGRSGRGREAIVPSICEHLALPYTGSDALTLAASLDKDVAKRLVSPFVEVAPGRLVRAGEALPEVALPAIVKPVCEGSSKGIRDGASVVSDRARARRAGAARDRALRPAGAGRGVRRGRRADGGGARGRAAARRGPDAGDSAQRRSTPVRVQPGSQARLAQPGALRGAARAAGRGAGGARARRPRRLRGARLPRRGAHRFSRDARRAAGLPGGEPAAGALAREGRHRDRDARGGHVLRRADRGDHRTRRRRGGAGSGARARAPGRRPCRGRGSPATRSARV